MTAIGGRLRPGLSEIAAMSTAIFLLAAGVPWTWTVQRAQGDVDTGGDVFVSLLFLAIAGFLGLQLNGQWTKVFRVLGREPLLLIFLWWAVISVFWSSDPGLSLRRVVAMVLTSYLGAHLVLRFEQFDVLRMVASVMVGVAVLNLLWITLLPQYSGPAVGQSAGGPFAFDQRLTGIYDNANSLGRQMALAVFTCVAALKLDRRRRPLYLGGIATAGMALALSQSKTSLVVSILTSLLLIVFLVFRARKQLFGAVVLSVLGSGIVSLYMIVTNVSLLTSRLNRDVTLSGRVPLWKTLITFFDDRPIQGHGFNGFWNSWGSPSHEVWNIHSWRPPHGHNQYIDVMLTLGLVGTVLYIGLQVRTFARATRFVRDVPGAFGLWPLTYSCFFLLISLTESGLVARDLTWFLYCAVVILVSDKKTTVERLRADPGAPQPQLQLR